MDLLEKIELFYKMAQQLESEVEDSSDGEAISNPPVTASVKDRMAKLAKLAKRSQGK